MPFSLGQAGVFLLALMTVFVAGRIWFALVEMVKDAVLRRFSRRKPEAWHPLPPEGEEEP